MPVSPTPIDIAVTPVPAAPGTAAPSTPGVDLSAVFLDSRNVKQASDRHAKAKQSAIDIRKLYWPHVKDEDLWLLTDRKRGGFAQVPRTLSIVMNIINDITKRKYSKAMPAGRTYLVLWLHHFGEGLVKIASEAEAAYEAGYGGQRNVATFRSHMKILQEIGFVDYRKGPKGPMHYVLMRSPYGVVKKLHSEVDELGEKWVSDEHFAALVERVNDIGSRDELVE